MAEHINKYETIMVLDSSKTEEEISALLEKFKSLIENTAKSKVSMSGESVSLLIQSIS